MTRVLFVCLGNICRSPTAEAVLRARGLTGVEADSAGTADWHVGKPPYGPMLAAARARGIEMGDLRARQVEIADFARFDHIVAMDSANLAELEAMRPEGARAVLSRLLDHAELGLSDVPDPYHTRDFDQTIDLVEAAIDGFIRRAGLA